MSNASEAALTPMMAGLILILLVALGTDLTRHKIPNQLILFGLVIGFLAQCFTLAGSGGVQWLIGVVIGFIGFFPLYLLRGMAAGDVKLMMVVGGFLGYPLTIDALVITIIVGGILAIAYVIDKGKLSTLIQNLYAMIMRMIVTKDNNSNPDVGTEVTKSSSVGKMPYAPAILIGTLIAIYFNHQGQAIF